MEMNVVSTLFDELYILFDEYIINHSKHFHEYKSVFKKKELIELIKNYENGLIPTEKNVKNKDELIDHLIYAFKLIGKYISSSDIFSKNEDVDDIHTNYLKFLLIPHILGTLCYETINIDIRFDRLKDAKLYFNEFITIVNIYNIVQINEYLYDDNDDNKNCDRDSYKSSNGTHNAINRRNIKIKRVKDEKKYQQIYNELAKTNLKKRENINFTFHNDNDNFYHDNHDDEEYREMYLSIIKYKLIQTLNTIDLMDTEMLVLEMRNKEISKKNYEKKNYEHGHNFPSLSNDNKPANNTKKPVIFKIKKNMQISDITQIRNYYKELVFKPFHNLPTISLEECAQIESQYALKGINNSENKNKNKKIKNKNIGNSELSDSDDDNEDDDYYKKCREEELEKDKNDREWDDWKYMHQKGIGNKNRNIT
ncbi:type 2A phosphatase-associated protein 42, putative [Plasmodium berghei]|uniref:Type 2A phosphatase-associated protein 42, putative n=2 Tax=Plasmodium berghei TaxID=5821 RepID=A0A509AMA6_PLABA|nr:type 2A phosphatase-associated protein 42, putative [Plasmodium berghei ANKA]CXI20590.1 type 2A phosphatase-associated protein 42, putative [Plasmodium berghei]SCM19977.1 type 2A phosphatase-associated protein 42, putative [Plasmodium berghei]SCN23671.1 type 2A phosphatase-associated protein 42, putative [Plasmodium berghei]SCO59203.1 type 2A phosphatase-associated protein 42, putative [Plasmodium berghei]SCO60016.1 type 2A phosphatase-associated protein 42, putative [Plasmodium berghei]|eukprot:XP_034420717.1 type 2A phosphatase-associated protein 42, putative [Plasmodium berghei ANKA]